MGICAVCNVTRPKTFYNYSQWIWTFIRAIRCNDLWKTHLIIQMSISNHFPTFETSLQSHIYFIACMGRLLMIKERQQLHFTFWCKHKKQRRSCWAFSVQVDVIKIPPAAFLLMWWTQSNVLQEWTRYSSRKARKAFHMQITFLFTTNPSQVVKINTWIRKINLHPMFSSHFKLYNIH